MTSQALIPVTLDRLSKSDSSEQNFRGLAYNVLAVIGGVILLSVLAQISIPLPWTPVPITGQTFGVSLVALLWGWKRGGSVMAFYLLLGSLGAPVFAAGKAGLSFGPTFGYLIGMLLSSMVVGYLSDLGATKSFWRALGSAYIGSVFVFGCGLLVLAQFIPTSGLLVAGLWPFLIGDSIKNILAALLTSRLQNTYGSKLLSKN